MAYIMFYKLYIVWTYVCIYSYVYTYIYIYSNSINVIEKHLLKMLLYI